MRGVEASAAKMTGKTAWRNGNRQQSKAAPANRLKNQKKKKNTERHQYREDWRWWRK